MEERLIFSKRLSSRTKLPLSKVVITRQECSKIYKRVLRQLYRRSCTTLWSKSLLLW